jgi:isopenicillin-N epimerase
MKSPERLYLFVAMNQDLPQPPPPLREGLRSEWLLDERIAFLNHGSFGAVPRVVFEEQNLWRQRIESEPVEMLARRAPELIADAKSRLGSWLGMNPGDFGLVTNATEGINAVLRSLELQPGDELLTTTHVYNAVRQAMKYVAGKSGAIYREIDLPLPVDSDDQIIATILDSISPRTRLLVIDHITSPTALVFPIERIVNGCKARDVDVLIDGAHAPGMVPLDVSRLGAAYYSGNLHKWACAPKGSAFLWVRPDRQSRIHPLVISHFFGNGFSKEFDWQGTRDFSAWFAIPRAITFLADLGFKRIMNHNHAMAVWAGAMLCQSWQVQPISPADGRLLGSMVTVPLPAALDRLSDARANELQRRLYVEHKIEVPLMQWSGRTFVRPCCQVYSTPGDYRRLSEAVCSLRLSHG